MSYLSSISHSCYLSPMCGSELGMTTRGICARFRGQKWRSSYYTLKVSTGHWCCRSSCRRLLICWLTLEWGSSQKWSSCSWTFFFSFSESWVRCTCSTVALISTCTMAPVGTWIFKVVGGTTTYRAWSSLFLGNTVCLCGFHFVSAQPHCMSSFLAWL